MKLILAVAIQIFLGPVSLATPRPPCIGTYRVAVNESEPLYFRDGNAQRYIGASQDIIDELTTRTNCKFNAVLLNRSRLISDLKSFRIDLIIVTVRNPVFDSLASFMSIETVQRVALLATEHETKHKTVADLINDSQIHFVVLPAVNIFFTSEEVERLSKARRFITAPTIQNTYAVLKRTPNAVTVQADWVHNYFINTLGLSSKKYKMITDTPKAFEIGIYYRSNIGNKADLQAISQALQDLIADGTWTKIKSKYANFPMKKDNLK
jgi:ABC-type amino acid transport substrate-binding protein